MNLEGTAEAERDVVDVLEEAMSQVEGVKTMSSSCRQGSASITLDLARGVDFAMQEVQTNVSQAQLSGFLDRNVRVMGEAADAWLRAATAALEEEGVTRDSKGMDRDQQARSGNLATIDLVLAARGDRAAAGRIRKSLPVLDTEFQPSSARQVLAKVLGRDHGPIGSDWPEP